MNGDRKKSTLSVTLSGHRSSILSRTGGSTKTGLLYRVCDVPPLGVALLLGFQNFIAVFGSFITYVYMLSPHLCLRENDPARGHILSTCFFVCGFASFIMATFGVRLPVVQGSTFFFLLPMLSVLESASDKCSNLGLNKDNATNIFVNSQDYQEAWMERMRVIQGAILMTSIFEAIIGLTGLVGFLLRFITPLSIGPTIVQLGISLAPMAGKKASLNWYISGLTMLLITIFSQYMVGVYIPIPKKRKNNNRRVYRKFYAFKMFGILFSILIVWLVCLIATKINWFNSTDPARTDIIKADLIGDSAWFRIPYPFQWGLPIITLPAVLAMISGLLTSMFDSVGDYYACAAISNAPPPPIPVINRGIFVEGLGCIISSLWGSGAALSSYSSNIGAIALTKVASRRVTQVFGLLMMVFSLCGKLSAIFVLIPEPVMGGVFVIMMGIMIAVGFSILKDIDLESPRNLFVLGFSLMMGTSVPEFFKDTQEADITGNPAVDRTLKTLLNNGMLITGFLGFLLDNTIPGTKKERGLERDEDLVDGKVSSTSYEFYRLPWNLDDWLKRYVPYFPIFLTKQSDIADKTDEELVKYDENGNDNNSAKNHESKKLRINDNNSV